MTPYRNDGGDSRGSSDPEGHRRTTRDPDLDDRFSVPLRGVDVDPETRCAHWDAAVDVVALRFGCCGTYYPCFACHEAAADHPAEPWPRDRFDEPAAVCGSCGSALSAREYLDCDDGCPRCGVAFNPGCRRHRDRYFER